MTETNVWTALITPLLSDGRVDFDSLVELLRSQESAGNGVLLLGSTGEALNMPSEHKTQILKRSCELGLSVPFMAGVGGAQLEETLAWVKELNSYPLDSYLCVTPLYSKPGDEGQFAWFEAVLNAAQKPCVLYNVPGRTAVSLSLAALERLANHPRFAGVKEASGSVEDCIRYVQSSTGKTVYCGDDALMHDFAQVGARGLISVASNVWPEQCHLYVERALSGILEKKEIELWKRASNSLFESSNPIPVKRLMREIGMIKSEVLYPPLSEKDLMSADQQLRANEEVNAWYQEFKNGEK